MGGGQKGGNNSNGNRGRVSYSFWLMLLVAFGAAMLGVMVVHKLRERRIFSLLIKEKDHQLLSLQTLLQKERVYNKEMTIKVEDMKRNIYSIRTEKMRLDKMVARMQSTIKSLKDEVETMESTVEEKDSEIKLLKEKEIAVGKDKHQLIQLLESLKQKEAEIDDLKSRLATQVKVITVNEDQAESDLGKGNNTVSDDGSENETLHNGGAGEAMEDIVVSSVAGKIHEGITDAMEGDKTRGKGDDVRREYDQKNEISKEGEFKEVEKVQENQATSTIEIKLENTDNSGIDGGLRYHRRHGQVNKAKVKKWKILARDRRLEKNDNSETNGGLISRQRKYHQTKVRDEDETTASTSTSKGKTVDRNINTSSMKFQKERLENKNIEDESSNFVASHIDKLTMDGNDIKERESKSEEITIAEKMEIPQTIGEVKDLQEPNKDTESEEIKEETYESEF